MFLSDDSMFEFTEGVPNELQTSQIIERQRRRLEYFNNLQRFQQNHSLSEDRFNDSNNQKLPDEVSSELALDLSETFTPGKFELFHHT
jgi:hypothetical protein